MMILSDRVQAGVIARMLAGEDVGVVTGDLSEEWLEYYEFLEDMEGEPPDEKWLEFIQIFLGQRKGHAERVGLIEEARKRPQEYEPVGAILADLPALEWLWEGWIPRGLLTLLVAEPGTGKSYFALDLAHRIVRGEEWPDGTPVNQAGNVLYVEAEHAPQVLKKRLGTWSGAALRRLFLMVPEAQSLMIDLNGWEDRERLLDIVYHVRPELLVVDSYGAVTLKGENAKEEVQLLLSLLTRVAVDYGCGVMLIHHPRKKSSLQLSLPHIPMTIHSVRGSSYLVQIARIVIGMELVQQGPELDRNGPRRVEVIKSNLDVYPAPLGIWFEKGAVPGVAALRYGDAPEGYRKEGKLEECMSWLVEVLGTEGAMMPARVIEWAEDEGFSRRTVYRARKALEDTVIDTEEGRHHPQNKWALVGGKE